MGYRYTNQVRLVMTPYSSAEVVEMAKRGDNPFVTISLSGTDGWNTWGVINEQMTKVKKEAGIKGALKEVLSSVFKITLSSVKTTSGSNEYYIFDAKVSLNDLQEALRFEELVNSLDKEFTFFFNTQDQDPTLREVEATTNEVIDRTFGDEDVVEEEVVEEDIDEQDLPF
jgi:predicted enzyme related to lactoylglutathione lyase